MRRKLFILSFFLLQSSLLSLVMAQPQKSRVQNNNRTTTTTAANRRPNNASSNTNATASRSSLMFPTAVDVPEEVTWRRDIYRVLDLKADENAALYFPVEARGKEMNLFTLLFQLLNRGMITAYQYKLDGVEDFAQNNRMQFKDMLTRYNIPYEVNGNSLKVEPADIPSSEVLSFYVKESSYYDQNTATYHSRVTALCPVLHRSDEFSYDESLKYPLFWVKYDDVKKYLSSATVMTSNVNNAARMSMDDFFSTNHYKGKIYMTTNMQNKTLQEMFPTDSLLENEQKRIEKEMADFEDHIWKEPVDSVELAKKDSIEAAALAKKKVKLPASKTASNSASRSTRRSAASSEASKSKKEKAPSTPASGAPRVSVRRQRH